MLFFLIFLILILIFVFRALSPSSAHREVVGERSRQVPAGGVVHS